MTDNIDKIVQEAERIAAADEYFKARTWLMDTNDNRRIFEAGFDRAYALLSKLRAPVADERAAQEYGSPADVAQRIEQYLAQDGRMNSGTQLLYEAMKALRASQGDRNDG